MSEPNTTQIYNRIFKILKPYAATFSIKNVNGVLKVQLNTEISIKENKSKLDEKHPAEFIDALEWLMIMLNIDSRIPSDVYIPKRMFKYDKKIEDRLKLLEDRVERMSLPVDLKPFDIEGDNPILRKDESSIEPIPVAETTAPTTHFVDNYQAAENDLMGGTMSAGYDTSNDTIPNFLAKPYLIATGSWSNGDAANTTLYSQDVGAALQSVTQWMNKLQGFNLIRATAVVRVTINANPFQQGRLILAFLPMTTYMVASSATSYVPNHTTLLAGVTQLPNIELDCRETSVVMKIPYLTHMLFYDIKAQTVDWGTMYVKVLSPLLVGTASSTSVVYNVWLSFEDVELAAPLVAQGKEVITMKESQEAAFGTVSQGLLSTSKIVNKIGSVIDIPGVPIRSIAWALSQTSKLAAAFGWAKPINEGAPLTVSRIYDRYTATCDGSHQSTQLALFGKNEIAPSKRFQFSDVDEMTFDFLKTVECFYQNFSWNLATATDAVIYNVNVSPSLLYQNTSITHGAHVASVNQGPPIWYLTNMFTYWRGSIVYKFKIIKNDFYSGRLLVTFTPRSGGTVATNATSVLAMREIIDIRTGNEFEITIPYYLPKPYALVTESIGVLTIRVLNVLRAPETCNGTINTLVFVRGGNDYELAAPGGYYLKSYSPFSTEGLETTNVLTTTTIGDMNRPPSRMIESLFCIGEKFTSIKQLISRYSLIKYTDVLSGSMAIAPWSTGMNWSDTTGLRTRSFSGDFYALFAPMYLFSRGSMKLMFSSHAQSQGNTANTEFCIDPAGFTNFSPGAPAQTASVQPFDTVSTAPTTYIGSAYCYNNVGWASFDSAIQNPSVNVPFYSSTAVRPNVIRTSNNNEIGTVGQQQPWVVAYLPSSANIGIRRSCGDDFQFSCFIGAPPVLESIS